MTTLRIILGDQLTHSISALENIDKQSDLVLMMEVHNEATYVPHHPKKIAFLFSAMRHFCEELKEKKINAHYIKIGSEHSHKSFTETIKAFVGTRKCDKILITEPGEWRVLEELKSLGKKTGVETEILQDNRFFCSIEEFKDWAEGKKTLTMEAFYRLQRKKHGILLDSEGKPEGGKWNYDKENRDPFKNEHKVSHPMNFAPDSITKEVLREVHKRFEKHFGSLEGFWFGVTQKQARQALSHFIKHSLPHFGDYQDAMLEGEYYLFHSALSQYINCGLLTAEEVCESAEKAYRSGDVPINNAEGFIRQILGWREFVRGIYWTYMPKYAERNALKAKRPLPGVYWGVKTKMNCMNCVVKQTEEEALSHHIQRLMVTGNFALIAGIDPKEVCAWYLAVYADAYEWVELPNTLGMSLYGDGGIVGTKPYAASGAYINRMSNFCKGCSYDVKKKTGEDACPFNFLYWDFLMRHEKMFRKNSRMKLVLSHLDKMKTDEKKQIKKEAKQFLNSLNT